MISVKLHLAVMDDGFETNTYIVTDEATGETLVVDPSLPEEALVQKLEGKNIKYILLTHGHYDHLGGVNFVKEKTGAKVVIHKEDLEMLLDGNKNEYYSKYTSPMPPMSADILVEDGSEIPFGNTKIKVLHTPGHTKGGVCYIFNDDRVMFSGDTLFRLTAGRTDLYGGDARTELMSLAKIGELDGDYQVYPGHDRATTLDFERQYNRYMRTRFRRK
ncbi:MAG: MBL fold metallo-hydrolase [Clostridia bacterium]|nr:MBL fold metallo-hydrolase [Clostridia bacterium]